MVTITALRTVGGSSKTDFWHVWWIIDRIFPTLLKTHNLNHFWFSKWIIIFEIKFEWKNILTGHVELNSIYIWDIAGGWGSANSAFSLWQKSYQWAILGNIRRPICSQTNFGPPSTYWDSLWGISTPAYSFIYATGQGNFKPKLWRSFMFFRF